MTAVPVTVLTDRFTRAVEYARIAHARRAKCFDAAPLREILLPALTTGNSNA